jgi:hypothetical protein
MTGGDRGVDSENIVARWNVKVTQGVAVDARRFYAISDTEIVMHDKVTGAALSTWRPDRSLASDAHILHLNGATAAGESLYAAHSRYGVDANDCSVEIFATTGDSLRHVRTLPMPRTHGSLTWIDRRDDGSWWMGYAVYGKTLNRQSVIVRYRLEDGAFVEEGVWSFPDAVIAQWGSWSSSGGSWGPDGLLYTTGHDGYRAYVLAWGDAGPLYARTITGVGFDGQGIAWDRSSDDALLWGIDRGRGVVVTRIPDALATSAAE